VPGRRLITGLAQLAYRLIARTPLRRVLRTRLAQRVKKSLVDMPASLAVDVTAALERAGVRSWVLGGWAADAVVGEQTRDHIDLDIVFEGEAAAEEIAINALRPLGFEFVRREPVPGWLPTRTVLSDNQGHLVDLHQARFAERIVARTADGRVLELDRAEAFTTGNIGGRQVPCLAARLQIAVHRGYESREIDRHDVALLCAASGLPLPPEYEERRPGRSFLRLARRRRPESALIVPVVEAEPLVGAWRIRHDPSASSGMPAHVTLLYPFVPPDAIDAATEEALRSLANGFQRFRFSLTRVGRFPDVLYLYPEPAARFVQLVHELWDRWPDHPPYRAEFDQVAPHLTVSQGSEPAGLADELTRKLPVEAEAGEIQLMTQDRGGRWSLRARFPLAAS
jgi:2'-5' RNA ligase